MDTRQDACGTCRFWQGPQYGDLGGCHHSPPKVLVVEDYTYTCWPETMRGTGWCGKHEREPVPEMTALERKLAREQALAHGYQGDAV